MSEKRIDINLLNVFYAVMIERNVTRAAERLSMTQPAVSNALNRLRTSVPRRTVREGGRRGPPNRKSFGDLASDPPADGGAQFGRHPFGL